MDAAFHTRTHVPLPGGGAAAVTIKDCCKRVAKSFVSL